MVNRFQTGSGTYTCYICGKVTRDTGWGETSGDLSACAFCFREATLEVELNDGHITEERYQELLEELQKEYGREI